MHQGEGMVEPTILEMLDEASSKARTGDILGAVESYRKATELDGSSASAWYGLAVMQAKRGNTADAVSAFEAHDPPIQTGNPERRRPWANYGHDLDQRAAGLG